MKRAAKYPKVKYVCMDAVRRSAYIHSSVRGRVQVHTHSYFIRHASWSAERAGGIGARAHLAGVASGGCERRSIRSFSGPKAN